MFQNLVEQLSEGILAVDRAGVITYLNPWMAQLLGRTFEELQGKPFVELLNPSARPFFLERRRIREAGISENYEIAVPHKEGHSLLFSVSATPIKDSDGQMIGAYAVFRDITADREIELALKESEAKFRNVFENIQDTFYRTDKQGRMILLSPSGAKTLGYDSVDELLGKSIPEAMYLSPADHARFMEALSENGFVTNFEETLRKKDGSPVIISASSHYYRDEAGEILGVEGIFFDITERKIGEQALREKEAMYRRIVDNIRDIIVSYAPDGTLLFVSESSRSLGYEPDFGMGKSIFEFVHPEDQAAVVAGFQSTIQGIPHDRLECRLLHQDGHYEWYEEYSEALIVDGLVTQVNGVIRNIQDRKIAEEALREREEMYRALVEHSHDGIFIIRGDRFLFVNARATGIVGYTVEELYGMNLWDLVHPEERARVQENAARRVRGEDISPRYNARIVHKSGAVLFAELSLSRVPFAGQWAVLGTLRDITQRLESEAALKHSEERYRLLVENQGEGVGYVDEEERILFVNRAAEEILGRSRDELLGCSLSAFTDPGGFQKVQRET
ncbi:MAG: PAS domain S-box protein, partial [Holophaga sp.]|nr:PAS domain S-box protein [Holophaga sp.]